jgi:hypothetical protein
MNECGIRSVIMPIGNVICTKPAGHTGMHWMDRTNTFWSQSGTKSSSITPPGAATIPEFPAISALARCYYHGTAATNMNRDGTPICEECIKRAKS